MSLSGRDPDNPIEEYIEAKRGPPVFLTWRV